MKLKSLCALPLLMILMTGCVNWEEGKALLKVRYPDIQLIEEAEHADRNVKLNLKRVGFLKYFGVRYKGETKNFEFVTVQVDEARKPSIALVHEPTVIFLLPDAAACDFDFGYD